VRRATIIKLIPPAKSVSLSSWKIAAIKKKISWIVNIVIPVNFEDEEIRNEGNRSVDVSLVSRSVFRNFQANKKSVSECMNGCTLDCVNPSDQLTRARVPDRKLEVLLLEGVHPSLNLVELCFKFIYASSYLVANSDQGVANVHTGAYLGRGQGRWGSKTPVLDFFSIC